MATFAPRGLQAIHCQPMEYINGFYNPGRRHSALGWKIPVAFERKMAKTSTWGGTKPRQVQKLPTATGWFEEGRKAEVRCDRLERLLNSLESRIQSQRPPHPFENAISYVEAAQNVAVLPQDM